VFINAVGLLTKAIASLKAEAKLKEARLLLLDPLAYWGPDDDDDGEELEGVVGPKGGVTARRSEPQFWQKTASSGFWVPHLLQYNLRLVGALSPPI
jgi:hypothetical protein